MIDRYLLLKRLDLASKMGFWEWHISGVRVIKAAPVRIAKAMGVTRRMVWYWLKGDRKLSVHKEQKLSEVLASKGF